MTKRPKTEKRKPKPAKIGPMLPTDRLAYSPITERAPLQLPNGARMAVWVIVNVEEWDATQPMPRTVLTPPAGGSPMPMVMYTIPSLPKIIRDALLFCIEEKMSRTSASAVPSHRPRASVMIPGGL